MDTATPASDRDIKVPTPIKRHRDTSPISVTRCKAPTYSDYIQIVPSVQATPASDRDIKVPTPIERHSDTSSISVTRCKAPHPHTVITYRQLPSQTGVSHHRWVLSSGDHIQGSIHQTTHIQEFPITDGFYPPGPVSSSIL